jgi:hypothetical protein
MMTEPTDETRILFALRTNVELFKTPEGYLELEERLKIASLLYDKLVLQSGFYCLQSATKGFYDLFNPTISNDEAANLRAYYGDLDKRKPSPEPRVIVQNPNTGDVNTVDFGPTEAIYFAEFQSLLANAGIFEAPWVEWWNGQIQNKPTIAQWIHQQDELDSAQLDLEKGTERSQGLEQKAVQALNHDIALSVALSATLSADPLHLDLMRLKLGRLDFKRLNHQAVVELGLPTVRDVPWDEIADLRQDPGMRDFRRVVNEIEKEIANSTASDEEQWLQDRIVKQWHSRTAEAYCAIRPSLKQLVADSAKGLVFDLLPLPGLGTLFDIVKGSYSITLQHLRYPRES